MSFPFAQVSFKACAHNWDCLGFEKTMIYIPIPFLPLAVRQCSLRCIQSHLDTYLDSCRLSSLPSGPTLQILSKEPISQAPSQDYSVFHYFLPKSPHHLTAPPPSMNICALKHSATRPHPQDCWNQCNHLSHDILTTRDLSCTLPDLG